MKIIAVGWNYREHNQEMNRMDVPQEPVLFMKPDSALLKSNKPFFIPDFSERVEYETEIIIRICRLGKNISERFASRYYDGLGVGIDFTARDLQQKLKSAGSPWEICKAFDGSAAISEFLPVERFADVNNLNFHLDINGKTVQQGNTRDQIFNIDKIIAYASRFFTLKIGDIIFTGTPAGVGRVNIDDHLQAYVEGEKLMDFYVR
ncbi:MAG: fumarylacetoacetate hydrolase family protein [Paludibacteraceae bacterium]|nr:fumarylacetoacetate hydrolase family protein [Paludibacteraceae bacterium]